MQVPTAKTVTEAGDAVIGVTLITIFLAASLIADLYGVSVVMDNTYSSINQMLLAGGSVAVKGFGLIKMRQAWREGFWPSAVAMGLLTGLVLTISVTNEMTYYNTNFSQKTKRLDNDVSIASEIAKEKTEIEDRIAAAGDIRPIEVIQADITIALAKTIKDGRRERTLDQLTKGCANTKSWAYDQCNHVLALRSELATATALMPQLKKDRARLEVIRDSKSWVTTVGETSPGTGFWVRSYNRYIDWRGYGEDHRATAQDGQDLLAFVCMFVLQMLNLFLPFAWFYRRPEKVPSVAEVNLVDRLQDGVGSAQHAVDRVQHAENRVQQAEIGALQHAVSRVQHADSDTQDAVDQMQDAENLVQHAVDKPANAVDQTQDRDGRTQDAEADLQHAACSTQDADNRVQQAETRALQDAESSAQHAENRHSAATSIGPRINELGGRTFSNDNSSLRRAWLAEDAAEGRSPFGRLLIAELVDRVLGAKSVDQVDTNDDEPAFAPESLPRSPTGKPRKNVRKTDGKLRRRSRSTEVQAPIDKPSVDQSVDRIAVESFVRQFINLRDDLEERSSAVMAAFNASPQGHLSEIPANHLTRMIREVLGISRDETHRDKTGARIIRGIELNEAGKRLLDQSTSSGRLPASLGTGFYAA